MRWRWASAAIENWCWNLALRQQLTAMKRATKRPHLQTHDRLSWIALRRLWRNWRTAVVLVQPDTVVQWHRDWPRRRWTQRSVPRPSGRPPVTREIRARACDGHGESVVGSAPDPRRAADPRCRRVRTYRVASAGTTPTPTIADVEDLPDESHRVGRLDGLLHGADAHGSGALRPGRTVAPPPAHPACQHHGASHGRVGRATSGRGLSGRHGTLLAPPRSRPHLWRRGSSAALLAWASRKSCPRFRAGESPAARLPLPGAPGIPARCPRKPPLVRWEVVRGSSAALTRFGEGQVIALSQRLIRSLGPHTSEGLEITIHSSVGGPV
jgi:hypothetical protein